MVKNSTNAQKPSFSENPLEEEIIKLNEKKQNFVEIKHFMHKVSKILDTYIDETDVDIQIKTSEISQKIRHHEAHTKLKNMEIDNYYKRKKLELLKEKNSIDEDCFEEELRKRSKLTSLVEKYDYVKIERCDVEFTSYIEDNVVGSPVLVEDKPTCSPPLITSSIVIPVQSNLSQTPRVTNNIPPPPPLPPMPLDNIPKIQIKKEKKIHEPEIEFNVQLKHMLREKFKNAHPIH